MQYGFWNGKYESSTGRKYYLPQSEPHPFVWQKPFQYFSENDRNLILGSGLGQSHTSGWNNQFTKAWWPKPAKVMKLPFIYRELLFKTSVTVLSFHATNAYNENENNTNGITNINVTRIKSLYLCLFTNKCKVFNKVFNWGKIVFMNEWPSTHLPKGNDSFNYSMNNMWIRVDTEAP
jgi:hypothetical protein